MIKLKHIFVCASIALLAACKNAEEFHDVVYMTGTESSVLSRLTIDGPATKGISATLSSKNTGADIKLTFEAKPELVDDYNAANGTKYAALPEGSYRLGEKNTVIKNGSNVSDPVMFFIDSPDKLQEGVVYMMPVSITSAEGVNVLESGKTQYIIINQVIVTNACNLGGSCSFTVPAFNENPSLNAMGQLSMECRIYMNSFANYDPYISSIIGMEDGVECFLLRFGDVTIKPNQLQLTALDQLTTSMTFDTGKWYHVAAVYDGASMSIYVNGQLEVTKACDKRGPVNLYEGIFKIGSSYSFGRIMNGYISEARVWSRALAQAEIEGNMCYVAPDSDGLLAYWRFNEGTGDRSEDLTGHGYHAERKNGTVKWVAGVRCPD